MTVQILGSEALFPEHLELDCRDEESAGSPIDLARRRPADRIYKKRLPSRKQALDGLSRIY